MKIASAQLWVQDQDEAVAFWTEKIGFEVRQDVTLEEMGNFRWLTVGPPTQEDVAIVLMPFSGPMLDADTQAKIGDLVAKGYAGTVFITTEDCRAEHERLVGLGVEFSEAPEERPYGIDAGFRDPSGNAIRLTQVAPEYAG